MNRDDLLAKAPVIAAPIKQHVFVCTGKACSGNGSEAVLDAFYAVLAEKGLLYGKRGSLEGTVLVTTCGSMGFCQVGPAVLVYPEGVWYFGVQPDDVPEIAQSHFLEGKPVERLLGRILEA